ncbi:MAG TPA: ABC transporter ATP-binding protein [Candidatus Saccharibacteria bacterium]|nr:ABC transporter ATP-binding protein [Candidatus Saccharibacteria bacterium]HPR10012.1 ABC transporter ATP-binding protein [Candidatus Saccharibacteria bacterium]
MLSVKGVTKKYGKKENAVSALKNIALDFEEGTTNAIVGKSGSGKSTLLHILIGLDRPTTGKVLAGGIDIFKALDTDTWRGQNVGIIFQQFFLQPNDSVLNNVALSLKIQGVAKKDRLRRAKTAIRQVGLADKMNSKANDLSGGQKQRIAIARAIVSQPSILIADEPTGNLDTENGRMIEDLLFALNKKLGTTLVIVTHDEDLARKCQRVVYLKDGSVEKDTKKQVTTTRKKVV